MPHTLFRAATSTTNKINHNPRRIKPTKTARVPAKSKVRENAPILTQG